jgi:hypothetical protein
MYHDLPPLAATLGFGASVPFDAHSRAELGFDADIRHAAIASGSGTLRALLLDITPGTNARAAVARAAHRAAARSPQLLWIVIAIQRATHTTIVAVPSSASRNGGSSTPTPKRSLHCRTPEADTTCSCIIAGANYSDVTHSRGDSIGRSNKQSTI